MKPLFDKFELTVILMLLALFNLSVSDPSYAANPSNDQETTADKSKDRPVGKLALEPTVIVARIADYVITREDLEKRLLTELYPKQYEYFNAETAPADANSVLKEMIAEKAIVIEARQQGYLEDESLNKLIKRFSDTRLINLLVQTHLQGMKDKIIATESEIQKMIQADPNTNPNRAKQVIENNKARKIISLYYSQIYNKFHVKKLSENYVQAIQIHDRLLNHPKEPQRLKFIRDTQIKEEMSPEERSIVLATYDNGKITLEDWFNTLCVPAPPSRPKNLNTPKGIEQLLERALMIPLYVSEAKLLKLDKNENLLKQIRDFEDQRLLNKADMEKSKLVEEPTAEKIAAYYNDNKETFRAGRQMKIDLIWCQDLETAHRVKAELDGGKDFEEVKQNYSLEKTTKPYNTSTNSEGIFWNDLWKAEPNDITGPLKGFYKQGIHWRIVKILEKAPGEVKEYSTKMDYRIEEIIMSEQREALLAEYRLELLKKYPHEIYAGKFEDIDPLKIP